VDVAILDVLKPLYFILGLADYTRERAEELREEFIRRGEEKGEDIREFIDDIIENIPMMAKRDDGEEDVGDPAMEEDESVSRGFLKRYKLDDSKESVRDIMDNLGLATAADLEDLHEKLDRMQETVKNLLKNKK
jgi:polyhydroxyalkanoate synthesis regulator phasin